jgi:hypothetical protein
VVVIESAVEEALEHLVEVAHLVGFEHLVVECEAFDLVGVRRSGGANVEVGQWSGPFVKS